MHSRKETVSKQHQMQIQSIILKERKSKIMAKNKEVPAKITLSVYANTQTVTTDPRTIHAHEASVKYIATG